ncbi:recombinase family protein [Chloroflexota bacterium]
MPYILTKRPAFCEMLSLAKSPTKAFNAVLIWKYSRFTRNRADSIVYKALLRKYGQTLFFLRNNVTLPLSGLQLAFPQFVA